MCPSAAPRVLLAFRTAAATHPGPLQPVAADLPLAASLRYAYATAIVAALIYIYIGGGTANSIMFWWRNQLTLIHSHTQTRASAMDLRVYSCIYNFSRKHTHIHYVKVQRGCDRFTSPSSRRKNFPYTHTIIGINL